MKPTDFETLRSLCEISREFPHLKSISVSSGKLSAEFFEPSASNPFKEIPSPQKSIKQRTREILRSQELLPPPIEDDEDGEAGPEIEQ